MKNLSQEEFNKELVTLKSNFDNAGISVSDEILHSIMISPATLTEDTGLSFPGGLACHINLICAIAVKLAKMISGTFDINVASIYKVCVCQHLAKIFMYVANDNQWEIDKRGMNYKFNDEITTRLKLGDRSLMYAQNNLGVSFNDVEWSAMECLDRDSEEWYSKSFEPILSTIIRQANELAYSIEKERYNKSKKA